MILTPREPTAMATKLPSLDTAASSAVILKSTRQDSENVVPCQIPCFTVPLEVTSVRVLFSANSNAMISSSISAMTPEYTISEDANEDNNTVVSNAAKNTPTRPCMHVPAA